MLGLWNGTKGEALPEEGWQHDDVSPLGAGVRVDEMDEMGLHLRDKS